MKSVAFIFSLILFSTLSFAQVFEHTDINLTSSQILDAKENGFYAVELKAKQESYWERAYILRKWSANLKFDWELEIISQKKANEWFVSEKNESIFLISYDYTKDAGINEYIVSSPWITCIDSEGNKKRNLILLHNSNLKVIEKFMRNGELNVLMESIEPEKNDTKEITWFKISDELEVSSSIFEVPAIDNNEVDVLHDWEMFGNSDEALYFYSTYSNLDDYFEGTVEFMKVDSSGNVLVQDISDDLHYGFDFLKRTSGKINITYSSLYNKFLVQTFNPEYSGFSIACFDMKGENLWKTEGSFSKTVKVDFSMNGYPNNYSVSSMFGNGLYGYVFLERESGGNGYAYLYDLDFGDEVAKKTFDYDKRMARTSIKYFVMDLIPDGQAHSFVKRIMNNAKSKKDLKKLKYSYYIFGEDELLFFYTKNGTDLYRFTD
jgi:hypothetical protein